MKLIIIAAVSVNGIIGIDNKIPWHIPEDLKHFKETTIGHPVVVGLSTFKTLPENALTDRTYLVLSGNNITGYNKENVRFFKNLELLLDYIIFNYFHFDETIYIAGGQTIYDQFMDISDGAIITWIDKFITFAPKNEVKSFPMMKLLENYEFTDNDKWLTSINNINYKILTYINKN